jgi:hypothetical protein
VIKIRKASDIHTFICIDHLGGMAYLEKVDMFIYGIEYNRYPEIKTKKPVKLCRILKHENRHNI